MKPTFSLCHSTARLPHGWRKAYETWRANADNWESCEYILAVDLADEARWPELTGTDIRLTVNTGGQTAVDGWNESARASSGKVMITAADDMFPPPHWDTELLKVIPDLDGEYAVEVKCGKSPEDDEWMRLMVHSIITRAYYKRIGNFFYPEYVGWYADADFTEMARMHGVVIDARHLTFEHRHWIGGSTGMDEIYQRQVSQANSELGMGILGRRRIEKFKGENRVFYEPTRPA